MDEGTPEVGDCGVTITFGGPSPSPNQDRELCNTPNGRPRRGVPSWIQAVYNAVYGPCPRSCTGRAHTQTMYTVMYTGHGSTI